MSGQPGLSVLLLAPQPFYIERGTPIAVRAAAETLARAGHRVDLLVYHLGDDIDLPEGVRVIRIPPVLGVKQMRPGPTVAKLRCLWGFHKTASRLVRQNRYDLVHAVEDGVFVALRLQKRHGLPFVYDMDSLMSEQVASKPGVGGIAGALFVTLETAAVRNSIHCLCVCPHLKDIASRDAPDDKLTVLTDFPLVDPKPPEADVRDRVDRAHGESRLVAAYVGNLEPYQGVGDMLEAARLLDDDAAERVQLHIYGGPPDAMDEMRSHYDDLVQAGVVEFCGSIPVDRLGEVLGSADILLSPRKVGTNTPMKLYGYLASGKPVLATSILSHTQVLDETHAELVEPVPAALAEGLTRLIQDEGRRSRLGRAGAALVEARHSRAAFERTLTGVYGAIAKALIGDDPRQS
ncbi:MAG: glycosyltransferase [Planctomycetota bacterium]